jgi:hypothetical protein
LVALYNQAEQLGLDSDQGLAIQSLIINQEEIIRLADQTVILDRQGPNGEIIPGTQQQVTALLNQMGSQPLNLVAEQLLDVFEANVPNMTPAEAKAAREQIVAGFSEPEETPQQEQARLAALQAGQMNIPNSPQIATLFNQLANLDPNSDSAQAIQARIAALQAQDDPRPLSPLIASMFNQVASLDPNSDQAQRLQSFIAGTQALQDQRVPEALLHFITGVVGPQSTLGQLLMIQMASMQP